MGVSKGNNGFSVNLCKYVSSFCASLIKWSAFKFSHSHLNTNLHNHTHLRTRYMIQSRQAPIVLWFTILQYQHYSSSTHIYTHKYLNSLLYMHSSVDKNNFLHGILISPAHSKNELLHNALLLLTKPLSFYIQRITTLSSLQTQTPCMA